MKDELIDAADQTKLLQTEQTFFDRFDICEAHYALEVDYNSGGWLQERLSNRRRMEATHVQLHRMGFRSPRVMEHGFDGLSENGKLIYRQLEQRYSFNSIPL